ncbi:MAG: PD40 domain-containing protein [Chloroflexi bacterium]|nr:PD40 domain-containing protein [Chloroflexota bacterium]
MSADYEHNTVEQTAISPEAEGQTPASKNDRLWLIAGCVVLICLGILFLLSLGLFASTLTTNALQARQATRVAQTQFVPTATALAQINATATAQAQWPLIASDKFDSNENDWSTSNTDGDYGKINQVITNGKYRWEVEIQQASTWRGVPSDVSEVSDFYVTAEMQQFSGPENINYGIIFRRTDGNNFYYFGINNAGVSTFALLYKNEWTSIINWADVSVTQPGKVNKITISAEGSHFTFYVNDRYIGEVNDDRLSKGRMGFMIEVYQPSTVVFEFDDFELRAPLVSSQLAPAATAASAIIEKSSKWPVILYDAFDTNLNDWQIGQSDNEYVKQSLAVSDGKYYWKATAHQDVYWWIAPDVVSLSDFRLTVDAERVEGIENAQYGVIFRKTDGSNFYYFGIIDTGKFALLRRYENEWTTLIDWTDSPVIHPGEVNQIRVVVEGSHFIFFINDYFVSETTDDNLSKGKAGLAMSLNNDGDEATFRFDNFDLRAPAAAATENPVTVGTVAPTSALAPTLSLDSNEHIVFVRASDIYLFTGDRLRLERLNTNKFSNTSPAWSPDGKQIAFSARSFDAQFDIYALKLDGSGELTKLTISSGSDYSPAWSPDGKYIAFVSDRDSNYEIYVMNADGSAPTRITKNTDVDDEPTWSPDSAHIAFTVGDSNRKIYIMNADGSDVSPLMQNSANDDANPDWSPDGSKIAFTSNRDGNYEIYIVNINGTGFTRVTNNLANDTDPAWSPDGKYIAFVSDRDGNKEIYIMNADGTNLTQLTNSPADDLEPAWRP